MLRFLYPAFLFALQVTVTFKNGASIRFNCQKAETDTVGGDLQRLAADGAHGFPQFIRFSEATSIQARHVFTGGLF
jgi:hypothetical protein